MEFERTFGTPEPIIGMVHLDALPGAPRSTGRLEPIVDRAIADARALDAGGADGIMVENFGDAPFYPDDVPDHTVASMTRVATEIARVTDLPLGVNVLRNDAAAAMAVAAAVDGRFIRVNVHTGARVSDQGLLEGRAHETLRLRETLSTDVGIFADLDVKHSASLGAEVSELETMADQAERGHADALVVSGGRTGEPVDADYLGSAVDRRDDLGLSETPILVGSGVDADSVADLLALADGAIVGTALKRDGETTAPVEESRVRELVAAADAVR